MIDAAGVTVGAGKGGDEHCSIQGVKETSGEHVTLPVYLAAAGGAERRYTRAVRSSLEGAVWWQIRCVKDRTSV